MWKGASVLAVMVAALLPASAFGQAQARRTVAVPRQIIQQLQQDSTEENELDDLYRDSLAAYLVAEPLDLNHDGIPELAIRGRGRICAANNCVSWIYRRTATGYERLLSTGAIQRIEPQATMTHGYRDVMTSTHGSAWDGDMTLYKFDGQRFRRVRCFTYTFRYFDAQGEMYELDRQRTAPAVCPPEN